MLASLSRYQQQEHQTIYFFLECTKPMQGQKVCQIRLRPSEVDG